MSNNKYECEKTRDRGKNYEDQSSSTLPVENYLEDSRENSICNLTVMLPNEMQAKICSFLDNSNLYFFSQSSKHSARIALKEIKDRYKHKAIGSFIATGMHCFYHTPQDIYFCGLNKFGQAGLEGESYKIFTQVPLPKEAGIIQQIIAYEESTLILTDKSLLACGNNHFGHLGLGDRQFYTKLSAVCLPTNMGTIKQLVSSGDHTFILSDNGLFGCGYNYSCQLGLAQQKHIETLTQVSLPKNIGNIQQIFAVNRHTFILADAGLFACGQNWSGHLGLGNRESCNMLTQVLLPKNIGKIQQIIAGETNTFLITDKGLFACGLNSSGQLGLGKGDYIHNFTQVILPEDIGKIQKIVASKFHTFIIADKGLFASGANRFSQLGVGDNNPHDLFVPVPLSESIGKTQQIIAGRGYTLLLTNNGIFACGEDEHYSFTSQYNASNHFTRIHSHANLGKIYQIANGEKHIFVLSENGVYASDNFCRRLGQESAKDLDFNMLTKIESMLFRKQMAYYSYINNLDSILGRSDLNLKSDADGDLENKQTLNISY